jgi:CheY-like chemotaxis protein
LKPIVVIEDDQDMREILSEVLIDEGYRVRSFANGAEALASLKDDGEAALIILDLMMPVMNGWRFCEEQSRDQELAEIPVIAMSAVADVLAPPVPRPSRMMVKPVNLERLLEQVRLVRRPS